MRAARIIPISTPQLLIELPKTGISSRLAANSRAMVTKPEIKTAAARIAGMIIRGFLMPPSLERPLPASDDELDSEGKGDDNLMEKYGTEQNKDVGRIEIRYTMLDC